VKKLWLSSIGWHFFLFSTVLYEKEIFKTKKFMLKKQLILWKLIPCSDRVEESSDLKS
ncbi:hypothetical protein STEG23_009032, partial [Scotinomys teguina]